MIVCIIVATVASLASARFANRVKSRTVGLLTGAVLTLLGAAMLILNFWSVLSEVPFFVDTLLCLGRLVAYIIPCVLVLLPIRFLTKIPSFVFRKLLHIVAFTSFVVMLLAADSWQSAALTSVIIAVALYPILTLLENESWYERLFVQKTKGEIKRSLLMLFFMFAAVIFVACGGFGNPYAAAAAILMWGIGDASAALIGIPFGKHKVLKNQKSVEGSCGMLCAAFLVGAVFLFWRGYDLPTSLLSALFGALIGTLAELLTPSEWDTVTVPVAILAVLIIML